MTNRHKDIVDGKWLKIAIKAQGETFRSTAEKLGLKRPDKFTDHSTGKGYLNFTSVAELLTLYPTMNARFLFTGEGEPVLGDKRN